jgi:hypothetical protein
VAESNPRLTHVDIEYEYHIAIANNAIADSANPLRMVASRQCGEKNAGSESRQLVGKSARKGPRSIVNTRVPPSSV